MENRRKFIRKTAFGLGAVAVGSQTACSNTVEPQEASIVIGQKPIVISTWNHGMAANQAAWKILEDDGSAIDAVEKGVMVTESDPSSSSVGFGGRPDREGYVTLDACIMNHEGDCGAVAFLEDIENPISVARKVMEDTPHVMLVGEGARQFAVEKGFATKNLLTDDSKKAWEEWKNTENYQPKVNSENHDTIGMLALDNSGNLSGACTTSGMAWKMRGRVGDSPIIGAGLFVDNEIGAACATGVGEAVIRTAGSHLVVEMMRQGHSPTEACKIAVDRVLSKHKNIENLQVGYLALNNKGEHGGYAVYAGFNYALTFKEMHKMEDCGYQHEW
ncbi:MAG: N(4)-(beta-N-acetylglucosaminyl)-L-asparaginase [Bacteroidota bacterium]